MKKKTKISKSSLAEFLKIVVANLIFYFAFIIWFGFKNFKLKYA